MEYRTFDLHYTLVPAVTYNITVDRHQCLIWAETCAGRCWCLVSTEFSLGCFRTILHSCLILADVVVADNNSHFMQFGDLVFSCNSTKVNRLTVKTMLLWWRKTPRTTESERRTTTTVRQQYSHTHVHTYTGDRKWDSGMEAETKRRSDRQSQEGIQIQISTG